MDYGIKLSEYWRFQLTYDWLELDSYQADELPLIFYGNTFGNPLDLVTKNSTYGAELTYKNILGKHRITTGIKSRFKKFDSMIVQGSINVDRPFETETVTSLFFQDQYKLSEREFLTFGINYGIYKRNDVVGDEDLLQLRLGYIYSGDTWGYKTYLSRAMFTLDPLSRYFTGLVPKEVQTTVSFTQELSYKLEDNDMRLMFMVIKDKNGFADTIGSGDTKYYFTMFNDEYRFDNNNQINLQLFYGYYEDIFIFDSLKGYGGHLSFTNSYESLNFYNGFTWQKYESDERLMIDWTSAISWEPTSGLTLSLKGTNLLNKSQEGTVIRIDPVLGQALDPLKFQLLDRRIILEIEYSF